MRGRRGQRRSFFRPQATAADVAAISPRRWYRATEALTSGGNLTSWPDYLGRDALVVTGTVPFSSGAAFDGSTRLTSPEIASARNHLHNGTGGSLVVIHRRTGGTTGIIVDTMNAAGNLPGVQFYNSGTTLGCYVGQAAGAAVVNVATPSTSPVGTTVCAMFAYAEGSTPEYTVSPGSSGDTLLAPTANDAGSTLVVGARANGANGFVGIVFEVLDFTKKLTTAEMAVIASYATRF